MPEQAVAGEDAGARVEAGRAALAVGDWERARAAFQASVDEAPSASALEGLGFALRWLGEPEAAMRALQRAYRLHRRAGDARAAARVALQLCLAECYFHSDVAVGLGWVERAERSRSTAIRGGRATMRPPRGPSGTTAPTSTSR